MSLLGPQHAGIPLPHPTVVSQPFWDGCKRGELLFQRCERCGTANFLPTAACRACLSGELQWVRSDGKGAVYSWTVVHRPQTPAFEVPYAVAIIDMDEGYQMMTNLIGLAPEDVAVGLRVEVDFRELTPEIILPYFKPAQA